MSLGSGRDLDEALLQYLTEGYLEGTLSRSMGARVLAGVEFFLPDAGSLSLSRRALRGWTRICPSVPYAPVPMVVALAMAVLASVSGSHAVAVAMLLSMDTWLRISEVAGLGVTDITDSSRSVDAVTRGVAVWLRTTKTGPRQAVRIMCPHLALLVIDFLGRPDLHRSCSRLFPAEQSLRDVLYRCQGLLGLEGPRVPGAAERVPLFVWHSFRHGGASRAFLGGMPLGDVMIRGRWVAESSARRYLQTGRAMLLTATVPTLAEVLASRLAALGLSVLLAPPIVLRGLIRPG